MEGGVSEEGPVFLNPGFVQVVLRFFEDLALRRLLLLEVVAPGGDWWRLRQFLKTWANARSALASWAASMRASSVMR